MLDLIAWRSNKSADKPALFFNGRWYTYLELNARANRLANRLHDLGVGHRNGEQNRLGRIEKAVDVLF